MEKDGDLQGYKQDGQAFDNSRASKMTCVISIAGNEVVFAYELLIEGG